MKRFLFLFLMLILAFDSQAQKKELFISNNLQLQQLSDSTFVHISWVNSEKYGRFSSNGIIHIKNRKAIMIDTPMDSLETKRLVNYLQDSLNVELTHFIPAHYHDDCISGLDYMHRIGVKSFANHLTYNKCQELKLPLPQNSFTDSLQFDFYGDTINCYFLGGGHTIDNIVVYFEQSQILFGGCLIKCMERNGIGNIKDADINAWPKTIIKAKTKFTKVEKVVPGHGNVAGLELFDHTLNVIKNYMSKTK